MKTAAEFIKYLGKIPEEKWTTGWGGITDNSEGCFCVYGHLGTRAVGEWDIKGGEEANNLSSLWMEGFGDSCFPAPVNDGISKLFPQKTPKQRVLAALFKMQSKGL